jgi:hypothetical protein
LTEHPVSRIKEIKKLAMVTGAPSTYYVTRYRSKLGVGARLLVLACLLGIEEIYFCGLDGYDWTNKNTENHAFEKEKNLPNWLTTSVQETIAQGYPAEFCFIQENQYMVLFDYINNFIKKRNNIKLIDVAKGQPALQYEFLRSIISLKKQKILQ